MLSSRMSEVMSSHLPGRKDASCRASRGGLKGTTLSLGHFAHLESCTESQFNHFALVNTLFFKKKSGKIHRQAKTEAGYLETLQELEVVRRFLRKQPTKCIPATSGLPPPRSCTIPSYKVGAAHPREL